MAKRTATSDLNDRNWDVEDEPEEAGEFARATTDVLKERVFIKPKRRIPGDSGGGNAAFAGFGGFSFGLNKAAAPSATNGNAVQPEKTASLSSTNISSRGIDSSPNKKVKGDTIQITKNQSQNGSSASEKSAYLQSLKKLNESVTDWIQQHVQKNPYCILTPVFKDYESHLATLVSSEDKEKSESESVVMSSKETPGPESVLLPSKETPGPESVLLPRKESEMDLSDKPPLLKTGLTSAIGQLSAAGSVTSTTAFPGFTFAVMPASQSTSSEFMAKSGQDDEEYVPPKPEVMEVQEEGSLYSMRCKLFYQKDGAWVERGVGSLHLKSINEKTQLLIRAETSLGNILLNIMLGPSIPFKKQGKNNISFVCVPNPPINHKEPKQQPTSMLLKVKTEDEANELLQKLNELKK
ncbi:hypothetical protein CHS0354_024465 [Potamilus streckersoni]|uniref:RanBD1 domain-containing protein n=1 Tax=Potamilus streckersoni TaxID=2493646 RepID=A0AAE0WHN8_9BIVA|nr:hypothetical protein CHS0354_024465 [Potamilus streckersoni]